MNAVVQKITMDERDSFDVEYLRDAIRACLTAGSAAAGMATFADMQTAPNRVKGSRKLSRPRGVYRIEVIEDGEVRVISKVKPAHSQWTSITHATATRAPGRSWPVVDEGHSYTRRYTVHALWNLPGLHVASMMARYATHDRRKESINALALTVSGKFRGADRKARARVVATMILWGYNRDAVREALGISPDEWRATRVRRLYSMVEEVLTRLDISALRAWEDECYKLLSGGRKKTC